MRLRGPKPVPRRQKPNKAEIERLCEVNGFLKRSLAGRIIERLQLGEEGLKDAK